MGGFYGSVHVRTDDATVVRAALEEVASELGNKFLIAPAIGGWVSAFPSENGQDLSVSQNLAARIKYPFLHCLVHDDDVFVYHFYEGGVLADKYNSRPDYFGGGSELKGGDISVLRSVLPDEGKRSQLKTLLERERFDFEVERLEKFAAILALPNAVSAYEYLQEGERDGIKQWKKFSHVPDLTAERTAKRAAKSRAKAAMKQLAKDGILLADMIGGKTDHSLFHQSPVWTIDPKTNEVLLLWTGSPVGDPRPTPILRIDSLTGLQQSTNLSASDHTFIVAIDPAGRWLAAGGASGQWETEVWDMEIGQCAAKLSQSRASNGLGFSRDGQHLFGLSEQTITIASCDDWKIIGTIRLADHCGAMAVHPGGEYLVVDSRGMLILVHIPSGKEVKTAWIDTRNGIEREFLEQVGPQAADRFLDAVSPGLSAAELEQQRLRLQRHFLPKQNVFSMRFSADGEMLMCGTNEGVCVFDWGLMLASPDLSALTPKVFVEAEPAEPEDGESVSNHRLIYSVIHDAARNRILYAGLEGKVRFLDLAEGLTGDLLVPPVRMPFWRLELTPERASLVGTAVKLGARKPEPPHFQIWNYPALCKAAGIPF